MSVFTRLIRSQINVKQFCNDPIIFFLLEQQIHDRKEREQQLKDYERAVCQELVCLFFLKIHFHLYEFSFEPKLMFSFFEKYKNQ